MSCDYAVEKSIRVSDSLGAVTIPTVSDVDKFKGMITEKDLVNYERYPNGALVHKSVFLPGGVELGEDVFISEGTTFLGPAKIERNAVIFGRGKTGNDETVIHKDVTIKKGSTVMGSNLGEGCIVGVHSTVNKSVLHANAIIGDYNEIKENAEIGKGTVTMSRVKIGYNATVDEGCVVCDGANIGNDIQISKQVVIPSNTKITNKMNKLGQER